jgi:L-glyceraldehyde 3-phosphate reductase
MSALDSAVKQGKALYAGISSYDPEQTAKAAQILEQLGTKCLIHQPSYSMLNRNIEEGLLDTLEDYQIGCIAFCPLSQGLLTDKYLKQIPQDSRAAKEHGFLKKETITNEVITKIDKLNKLAKKRNQSLAQMALAWILKDARITSVLIGASKPQQIIENVNSLKNTEFSAELLAEIDNILNL